MAALIWGGETWKLAAICGSEVEMMEESRPSMKKAPAMTVGTIRDICAAGGSVRPESNSVTNKDARSMRRLSALRQAAYGWGNRSRGRLPFNHRGKRRHIGLNMGRLR